MKKRLLLLLCLLGTAGSAAWADIANGTCKNGSWVIDNSGKLTVNIDGDMKDYGEGKAPWYEYWPQITAIHIGSKCTNIGRNGFYGLKNVKSVTGGLNVQACAMYSFQDCGTDIPDIYLPSCGYVGECAFAGCDVRAISLPWVKTWKVAAISGWYNQSWNISQQNIAAGFAKCEFVDLGRSTEKLRPGSLMGVDYVFCQNPTPPEWERLYDRDEWDYAGYWFGKITTFGAIGGYEGREYEYPFGDNPDVKFLVPQEYLQTYKNFYPKNHPEVQEGYMCAYYTGVHSKKGETLPTGKLYAGGPIYDDGKLVGGWYLDGTELHAKYIVNTLPRDNQSTVAWRSVLGQATTMCIEYNGDEFIVPDYGLKPMNDHDNLIHGIKRIKFKGMNSLVFEKGAFGSAPDVEIVEAVNDRASSRMPLKVGAYAFSRASKLTRLEGFDITELGESAFQECTSLLRTNASSWTFSASKIPDYAFYNCQNLDFLDISKVRTIGKKAFAGSSLDDVDLSSATSVGEEAFSGSDIKKIVFGPSTNGATFGSKCFAGCSNLENIDVSSPLTSSITASTFSDVTLSGITLNVGPKLYGNYYENHSVFGQMKANKLIDWPVGSPEEGWEITRGQNDEDCELKIYRSFDNFTSEKSQPWHNYREFVKLVNVLSGIKNIGSHAFSDLPNVTSVVLPHGIKGIGSFAFKKCPKLKRIRIAGSKTQTANTMAHPLAQENSQITGVETLGNNVFEGCSALEYIDLGTGLKKAGNYIFKDCISLEAIGNKDGIPAEVTPLTFAEIGSQAYQLRGGRRMAASGQAAVTLEVPDEFVTNYIIDPDWGKFHIRFADSRGTWQHAGPFGDGTWILYDDSTMVVAADKGPGDGADNWKWSELRFSSEVAKKTKRVEISGKIPYLCNCFMGFENLTSVSLCPSIKKLEYTCFYDCKKLSDINLDNVEVIGEAAFNGTGLTSIDLSKVKSVQKQAFSACRNLVVAKLGSQCEVSGAVFSHCSALTAVDLGDVNLDNASSFFSSCTSLKYVTYNGRNLPHNIFYNCTSLTTVKLGASLRSIYWDAFEGCTALNTVICDSPTPPTLPKGVTQDVLYWDAGVVPIYGPEYDVWAFNGLTLSNIELVVPESLKTAYRAAHIWKDMNIQGGEDDAEPILPAGGSLGKNGTWYLGEDGVLVIDASGDIPAYDSNGKPWSDTFNAWAGLINTVVFSDGVTSIPANFFGGDYFSEISGGIHTVKLGRFLKSVGENSLSFSGINDVYIYSEALLELKSTTFDLAAAVKNNATLHVLQASDGRYSSYYASNAATKRFPHIVADLDGQQTVAAGTLGTKGYWTFADGVLTVTYNGAMPTITRTVTDPEQAFRFKWIDFLSQIEEVVVTGTDVEVQPYFLYYEGDGDKGQHPDDHISTLTFGAGVKSIGKSALAIYDLKRVNCYGKDAPVLASDASGGSSNRCFWKSRVEANRAFLWTVPNASTGYAMINSEWAYFNHSAHKLNPEANPKQESMTDFETGNMSQIAILNDDQYPWEVTKEDAAGGTFSMKSGNKGVASSSSAITAYFLYETDGIISFDAKFMGEGSGSGWDKCMFYIDGELQFSYGARGNGWFVANTFPVSAGMHTFKWEYTKDSSVDAEGDAFFVDNIYFLQNGKDDDLIDGVESIDNGQLTIDNWFDLIGRHLDGKPTQPGIYINGGRKVVVK